jgi:hypothetical protein
MLENPMNNPMCANENLMFGKVDDPHDDSTHPKNNSPDEIPTNENDQQQIATTSSLTTAAAASSSLDEMATLESQRYWMSHMSAQQSYNPFLFTQSDWVGPMS